MQKKAWTYTMLATLLGAVGVVARWLQCMNIFEEETGLPKVHAPISYLVAILLIAAPIALWVYARRIDVSAAPEEPEEALVAAGKELSVLQIVAAVICAVGAALLLLSADSKIMYVVAMLAILSVPAVALLSSLPHWGSLGAVLALIPVLFFGVWLSAFYLDNSVNPVLWEYCVQILAIAACLLAAYRLAAYPYYRAAPRKAIFACGLALTYCLTVLMDDTSLGARVLFAGWGVFFGAAGWLLIRNLREPERKDDEDDY